MPEELQALFTEKMKLESTITQLIAEFEERYAHKIEIDDIRLERMRIIGPHKALCRIILRTMD